MNTSYHLYFLTLITFLLWFNPVLTITNNNNNNNNNNPFSLTKTRWLLEPGWIEWVKCLCVAYDWMTQKPVMYLSWGNGFPLCCDDVFLRMHIGRLFLIGENLFLREKANKCHEGHPTGIQLTRSVEWHLKSAEWNWQRILIGQWWRILIGWWVPRTYLTRCGRMFNSADGCSSAAVGSKR